MRTTVRLLALLLLAAMLSAGQGCPGPTPPVLPGSSTIDELLVSDAVVGDTGRIRVTLLSPVAADTEVTLTSSNPAVAAVPPTVVIPQGSDTADILYNAAGVGAFLITAQLGASTQSISIIVVSSLQLTRFYSFYAPLEVGASGNASVELNMAAPSPTVVQLTSSDPVVASVPATVTIAELYYWQNFPVQALSPGVATITATLGSSQQSMGVMVVATSVLSSLSSSPRVVAGTPALLSVNLNAYTAVDRTVTLASSNPAALPVPASIVVPAGSYYASINVPAVAEGGAMLTATLDSVTQSFETTVVNGPSLQPINSTNRLQIGATVTLSVSLDIAAVTDTIVTLNSSNPAVISVPSSVTISPGQTTTSFPVTAPATGTSLVTATSGSSTQGLVFTVVTSPVISSVYTSSSQLQVGAGGSISFNVDAAAPADTLITVTADTPGIVSTPGSLFLPAGSMYGYIPVLGLAPGNVNLTITAFGSSWPAAVTVVSDVHVATVTSGLVKVGKTSAVTISLDAVPAGEVTVTLASGDLTKLTLPATMTISAGSPSGSTLVTGVAVGGPVNVTATSPVLGPPVSAAWFVAP